MCTETTFEIQQRYPDYGEMFCNEFKAHFLQELFALTGRDSIIPDKPAGSSDAGNVDVKIPVFHPMSMLMYRMATEQELFDQIKKDHREYRHL